MDPVVEVTDAALVYRLERNRVGTFKEFVIRLLKGQVQYEELRAVDGVTFSVMPGEMFGIIGPNGAGKSTLLKLLARVLGPTEGRVIVRGSTAPMIELGAGFNPELTGRENIVLYGALLGRSVAHMKERVWDIASWAELTDFLDVPVRSYSSGMLARLGFAVAIDSQPDLLLVDEVLSVGDEQFQKRSSGRMNQLIEGGTGIVLVTHALETVIELADRAMWIDHGKCMMIGDPKGVVGAYRASLE